MNSTGPNMDSVGHHRSSTATLTYCHSHIQLDIIAFRDDDPRALIVDPTIRYETNDLDKASNVEYEKHQIYSKCVEYYNEKYFPIYGNKEYKVYGLLFGSRGTPSTSVISK